MAKRTLKIAQAELDALRATFGEKGPTDDQLKEMKALEAELVQLREDDLDSVRAKNRIVTGKMVRVRALRHLSEDEMRVPGEVFEVDSNRRKAIAEHLVSDAPGAEIGKPKPPAKPKE